MGMDEARSMSIAAASSLGCDNFTTSHALHWDVPAAKAEDCERLFVLASNPALRVKLGHQKTDHLLGSSQRSASSRMQKQPLDTFCASYRTVFKYGRYLVVGIITVCTMYWHVMTVVITVSRKQLIT